MLGRRLSHTLAAAHAVALIAAFIGDPTPASGQTRVTPVLGSFDHGYFAEVSHAPDSTVHEGRTALGDLATTQARVAYLGTYNFSDSVTLLAGADWQGFHFERPALSPIPDSVQSIALKLGHNWGFAEGWTLRTEIDPGIYSDFEDLDGGDFNIPFGVRATWQSSTNVLWVFGLSVDPRGDWPVVGGPGVRWRLSQAWTLNLVMPRPRIEFAASRQLSLFAGGELKGGSYRLAEDFGRRQGRPELANEMVSYREIRAGAGLRYRFSPSLNASIEAGWLIDRRFNFPDEDLQLNGDGAPYIQAGLSGTF